LNDEYLGWIIGGIVGGVVLGGLVWLIAAKVHWSGVDVNDVTPEERTATSLPVSAPSAVPLPVDEHERLCNLARTVLNRVGADVRGEVGSDRWISLGYSLDPWIAERRNPRAEYNMHLWLLAPKVLAAYPQATRFSLDATATVVSRSSGSSSEETLFSAFCDRANGLLIQTGPFDQVAARTSYWHEDPLVRALGY
jgi:hypothetical protein